MKTVCKVVVGLYVILSIAALALIPLNAAGWAGAPDPLSGVFAVLLAQLWISLAGPLASETSTAWNMVIAGGGMALNALILWFLCRWLAGRTA